VLPPCGTGVTRDVASELAVPEEEELAAAVDEEEPAAQVAD